MIWLAIEAPTTEHFYMRPLVTFVTWQNRRPGLWRRSWIDTTQLSAAAPRSRLVAAEMRTLVHKLWDHAPHGGARASLVHRYPIRM